jgi:hypothetical protein
MTIKKRLVDDKKGKWTNHLPDVLWVPNTTKTRAIRFTPFKLMYGAEALTLQELKLGSPQTKPNLTLETNKAASKDLLEAIRVEALDFINK